MAWKWRVVNKAAKYESGEVDVGVVFFDDADPGTLLHNRVFSFPAHFSTVELLAAVKEEGARARRSRQQTDVLLNAIVVDSEGAV